MDVKTGARMCFYTKNVVLKKIRNRSQLIFSFNFRQSKWKKWPFVGFSPLIIYYRLAHRQKMTKLKFWFFLALHFWSRNASYLQFLPRWPHLGSKVANIQQANVHQFETNSRKPCYNSNFTDSIDSVKRKASQREGKPISFRFYLPLSFYNILDRAYRPETTDFHWSVEQANTKVPCVFNQVIYNQ